MIVKQLSVGPMANFVYLLVDEKSREAAVIDSGWETDPLVAAAKDLSAKVWYAIATHEHFDHTATLVEVAEKLGAKVVAHQDSPIRCDLRVNDGDELKLGRSRLQVLHTPGHTEDSICIYDGREVFTGDTLFVGTIGRFEKARAESMYRSLNEVILKLPERTILFPGHDYGDVRSRTLREERGANPFLMARDLRSFLSLFS